VEFVHKEAGWIQEFVAEKIRVADTNGCDLGFYSLFAAVPTAAVPAC
jgi:hypothetical protein